MKLEIEGPAREGEIIDSLSCEKKIIFTEFKSRNFWVNVCGNCEHQDHCVMKARLQKEEPWKKNER